MATKGKPVKTSKPAKPATAKKLPPKMPMGIMEAAKPKKGKC